jgi:hypothetical protein
MTDPFVQQLADMCRRWPTRTKWVIVPSHALGHTLGDRLVRDGSDWANPRFVTPLDFALRMTGPFLVERGVSPSEATLGPALMIRLLIDLPTDEGYFRPIADQPTMGDALWRTVRELRMAGLRARDLLVVGRWPNARNSTSCDVRRRRGGRYPTAPRRLVIGPLPRARIDRIGSRSRRGPSRG